MTESLTYDFDALAAARDDITAAVRDLDQLHGEVAALMGPLSEALSDGATALAWHVYQLVWNAILADITYELDYLGGCVGQCHQNAVAVEAANEKLWNV